MSSPITRIAILDDYQDVARSMADWTSLGADVTIASFRDSLGAEDMLAERLRDVHVIVAMRERTAFPSSLLERLPALKLLVTTGRRNAAIDLAAAARRGVLVSGTSTQSTPPVELTWGLILAVARRIPQEAAAMRADAWQTTVGVGLRGKVLGVIGLGRLGSEVAKIGKAFGMEVVAWSQNLTTEQTAPLGVERVDKDTLLQRADVVTIHLVLSARTRGLIGAAELDLMKRDAILVNTARGPIVDEGALVNALQARRIGGAGLDVFDREPLPSAHPLRQLDNVVLTPHLGYVTVENYREMYGQAVEDIRAFLDGSPIRLLQAQ